LNSEANYIGGLLYNGNANDAANVLNSDLFQMRGDIYAQDALLSQVQTAENSLNQQNFNPDAATLNFGNWDPNIGTWDNKEIDAPGMAAQPVQTYDSFGNPINDQF
jgi:hypothetical protein